MSLSPELASDRRIMLIPLDEPLLRDLLATAVAEAEPAEVMPDPAEGAGWSPEVREAFLRFHLTRSLSAAPVERTYAVVVDGTVAGAARLAPLEEGEGAAESSLVEGGVWLGRAYRGSGIGKAVLRELVHGAKAFGAARLRTRTSRENTPALHLIGALEGVERAESGDEVVFTVHL